MAGNRVNLALLALAVAAAACGRPTLTAPLSPQPRAWPAALGGPARAGYADAVAPEQPPEVVWRAGVGRGLLAPLIVEDSVLFVSTTNRMVAALSTGTGEHYWERRLDGALGGGLVRAGERLFVAEEKLRGRAWGVGAKQGREAWERRIGSSPFSPLLVGDTVLFATEGGLLLGLDAADGDEIWRARLGAAAAATPVAHGPYVVVPIRTDSLLLIERGTGTIAARAELPAGVAAAPALLADTLLLPLHDGSLLAVVLPSLETLWRAELGAPILASPVVAADGTVYALSSAAELWRVPSGGRGAERLAALGGAARASLTLARERLLVGRLDGALFLLRPDGTTVWRYDLDDSIAAPAAVHDGAVYVPLLRGDIVKLR